MKTLAFAAYVVIAVAMIHAYDHDEEINFHKYFDDCAEELNVPKAYTGDISYCVAKKTGAVDENDELIWNKTKKLFNDVVEDQGAGKCAVQIIEQCLYNAQQAGGTNHEKMLKVGNCASPVLKVVLEQDVKTNYK